ncbi:MAG TPA: chemotaxis protein CheW [Leptospiraceae bacterium]|nr:chemotaxis protein CheW [Leptospiraceae bacterium]HMX31056.1 chemotaxis protein CheW [Leptospiraceae bacterium]HMY31872.1 chemotaxis protein CheW [Leptospiraceae bacterium]HMZ63861.1 chemotaxis protein CheW [Leptospiraceae bacterium]HNA06313.1 chemotaxis protein CheW [Leptospiraceae bacterium]
MSGILGEYTEIFLEESEDQIEELNANLLRLENDHNNPEIINDIFRAAHSLKSSAAFVGLYNLSDLAHKMENLLQKIREGKFTINVNLVNLLFECFDLIKDVIDAVARGEKKDNSYSEMIAKLENYEKSQEGQGGGQVISSAPKQPIQAKEEPTVAIAESAPQSEASTSSSSAEPMIPLPLEEDEIRELEEELKLRNAKAYDVRVTLKKDTPMKGLRFTLILQNLKLNAVIYKSSPDVESLERGIDQNFIVFILMTQMSSDDIYKLIMVDMVDSIDISLRNIQVAVSAPDKSEKIVQEARKERTAVQDKETGDKGALTKSIKVSSEKLDQLMNNVGELVITNSGFQKIYDDLVRNFGDDTIFSELKSKIDQINRISKDLQSGIMNTRMVPIGSVFNRFSRLVRDLSVETGKKVHLNLMGENTELDKKVVDMIGEPMLHLIRNSIDHGIESPAERVKAGKPEYGTVELNAYQGGNNIMVEIKDDGRGLNKSRILKKAIENNLVSAADAQNLADNEVYQFIFAAGFSTASEVTDISGRGVGMNVVNKLIQDFKGKILINTTEGFGTSFTLCFPQALAIIPSILVSMEEEIYAFPLSEVFETIRIKKDQINTLEGHEIINLRGEVLPIYRLNKIIGLADKLDLEEAPVVIVNYNSRKLGFIVDELIGKHETVIKTLEKNYKNIKGLTGASIMGDGTIILVLDIGGLIDITTSTSLSTSHLVGKEMMRLNTSRSIDVNTSNVVFKTQNSTNLFNNSLLGLQLVDKSKKKKDKTERKRVVSEQETVIRTAELNAEPIPVEPQKTEPVAEAPKEELKKENQYLVVESEPESKPMEQKPVSNSVNIENLGDTSESDHEKARELLKGFSDQTKKRVESLIHDRPINEMLSKEEIRKLESVVNTGMMNAGLVLSQLVGSNVELFMPEIMLTDKDELVNEIRDANEHFFGMKVRMNGDLNGNLLMIFSEQRGKELAGKLLKENEESDLAKKMSDDSLSVLMEISNIVCSSVMNSLSNKAKAQIMPSVPELVTGNFKEVLDIVKPEKTKFLSMNTEFIYEGDNLIGNLLFLPDFDELVKLISRLS